MTELPLCAIDRAICIPRSCLSNRKSKIGNQQSSIPLFGFRSWAGLWKAELRPDEFANPLTRIFYPLWEVRRKASGAGPVQKTNGVNRILRLLQDRSCSSSGFRSSTLSPEYDLTSVSAHPNENEHTRGCFRHEPNAVATHTTLISGMLTRTRGFSVSAVQPRLKSRNRYTRMKLREREYNHTSSRASFSGHGSFAIAAPELNLAIFRITFFCRLKLHETLTVLDTTTSRRKLFLCVLTSQFLGRTTIKKGGRTSIRDLLKEDV